MPYTFQLSFTGLCILTFNPNPTTPSEANVLLVNAGGHGHGPHDHLPRLCYRPRNVDGVAMPDHTLVPTPDGSQLALQDLAGETVEVEILPSPGTPRLEPVWRDTATVPTLPTAPASAAQEEWLDWVMALKRMNPETPFPGPHPPHHGLLPFKDPRLLVAARVKLTHGRLQAANFPRTDNMGTITYLTWDFKTSTGTPVATHAMAGTIILSVANLADSAQVRLKGRHLDVSLVPAPTASGTLETLVAASITNLPAAEDPAPTATLHHFVHYYDLADFASPPPELRLPVRRGSPITSTTVFCPPTGHVNPV